MPPACPTRSRPSSPSNGCARAPSSRTPSPPAAVTKWSARCARVLVDSSGQGRTVHEAPEIDGVVRLPSDLVPGDLVDVLITAAEGPDLVGEPVDPLDAAGAPHRPRGLAGVAR